MEHGPYIPTTLVVVVPATATTAVIPERTIVKNVIQWTEDDKSLVNIDTKARSLLSMSMSDDVFHSVCHLKASKEIWDTLRIQYEGADSLLESRKINLVRQYEMFISTMGETLSLRYTRGSTAC